MKRKLWVGIVSVIFGIAVGMAAYFGWFSYAELFYEDILYQQENELNNNIKIIAIDDKTMSELGDYGNWSRQYYADLVNTLNTEEGKPAVIAFDIMFFDERDAIGDTAFADACMKHGNAVVASKLESSIKYYQKDDNVNVERVTACTEPYEMLYENVSTGYVNTVLDDDGFARHTLARIINEETVLKSFSSVIYEQYMKTLGYDEKDIKVSDELFWIDYAAKPGSYEMISMCDVLNGNVPADTFRDCIVLVGGCSVGMMDSYGVPIDRKKLMYGVEINANIIQSFIDEKHVSYLNKIVSSIIIGCAAGCFLAFTNRRKIKYMTTILVIMLTCHVLICLGLYRAGVIIPVLYSFFGYIAAYFINIILKYVSERRLRIKELRETLFSMAEAMTEAIDGRTPYNASHTRHVAEYSVELAEYINVKHKKGDTKLHLSKNEIEQLHLAALLHDVGKLDISHKVLDKPSRLGDNLETFLNRIEKLQLMIKLDIARAVIDEKAGDEKLLEIDRIKDFVDEINSKEWLSDEEKQYIEQIRTLYYEDSEGQKLYYLSDSEYECLTIAKGTLTKNEIEKVHEHVVYTDKILGRIKFGRNYGNVRKIAGSHHEFLNGKGYPNNLNEDEIDTATRILTIADVYDALTADDRPYKKAKSKEDSFKILHFMEKDGEIDGEILGFAEELWM